MPEEVNNYKISELGKDGKKKIIINTENDIEIGIEVEPNGTRLYLYFGGKVIKREFDYLITQDPEVKSDFIRKSEIQTLLDK